jgi:predicted acetyltransferase
VSDSLQYRFADDADVAAAARLAAHSFPGAPRSVEWWDAQLRDPHYGGGADTLLIGEHGGAIAAALQLHRLRQWTGGRALATAGIGSVSISPAHRRRGLAAQLVTAALRAAHERGDAASLLYPFRVGFYQRLGYGRAGSVLQYLVPASALAESPERRQVELLETDDARGEALALYNDWARAQNGQLERGARVWRAVTDAAGATAGATAGASRRAGSSRGSAGGAPAGADGLLAGWRSATGGLEGYALARYRTDLAPPQRYLEVEELVWSTPAARRGLYAWLASLADQWPRLLLRALPAHRLGDWLDEPRLPHAAAPGWRLWEPEAVLLAGPMFRLVNMQQAWEGRPAAAGVPTAAGASAGAPAAADATASVCLEVTDAQLPHNSGTWCLTFSDGAAHIQRGGHADITLRLGIDTLSRIFIGALAPSAALDAGLLECDRPDRLHRLDGVLALTEPWTFDRF